MGQTRGDRSRWNGNANAGTANGNDLALILRSDGRGVGIRRKDDHLCSYRPACRLDSPAMSRGRVSRPGNRGDRGMRLQIHALLHGILEQMEHELIGPDVPRVIGKASLGTFNAGELHPKLVCLDAETETVELTRSASSAPIA